MLFCTSLVVWVNVSYFSAFERVSTATDVYEHAFLYQSGCAGKCRLFSAFERVSTADLLRHDIDC